MCVAHLNVKTIFLRPMEFIECDDPTDLKGNKTRDDNVLDGCYKVIFFTRVLVRSTLWILNIVEI